MHKIRLSLLTLVAVLAVPATAAAHKSGPAGFERTFPAESRLCAAVADGNVPTPLQGHEAEVTAACAALHSAYDAAAAGATGAPDADALKAAIADARAQVEAACGEDATDLDACAAALRQAHRSLKQARHGKHAAKRAYRRAINEARHAFRRAIKPLIAEGWHRKHAPEPDEPSGDDVAKEDAPTGDAPTTEEQKDEPTED